MRNGSRGGGGSMFGGSGGARTSGCCGIGGASIPTCPKLSLSCSITSFGTKIVSHHDYVESRLKRRLLF